jgi:hypothetical protein
MCDAQAGQTSGEGNADDIATPGETISPCDPDDLHWSSAGRRVKGMKLDGWVGRADMACAGVCI